VKQKTTKNDRKRQKRGTLFSHGSGYSIAPAVVGGFGDVRSR